VAFGVDIFFTIDEMMGLVEKTLITRTLARRSIPMLWLSYDDTIPQTWAAKRVT
jgi:hypothetical protein